MVLSSRIIGKIDAEIYESTDLSTGQKILSLARYLLATNGQSFPGITTWQFTHPLPYEYGFSEARFGFNKAHDGLETVKLLTLYSIDTRQPVVFTKQPGNQPDVITIENALKQLQVLGVTKAEIVTDNGYYSEKKLASMLHAHFDFITLIKIDIKWVKQELNQRLDEFRSTGSACPFDTNTHGITVMLMHEFSRTRKYASRKKGLAEGDEEVFSRRIYLHLYFNLMRRVEQDAALDKDLFELKALIEDGVSEDGLSVSAIEKVRQYMYVRHYGSKITVTFNEKAIAATKKYHVYFALVSNCEKNAFECLQKYRRRETVELFFEAGKQKTDGNRTRVWSNECLMGQMFVQFVALCYYEYFSEQLRQMKQSLAAEIHDTNAGRANERKTKKKLLSWLQNQPVYLTLQWFDAVEETRVSSPLRSKRWTTEITERDQLFLRKLGIELF